MSSVAHERLSPEEYLCRERAAETKSEYDDGFVYGTAGLICALCNHLQSRCEVYPINMRVRIAKRSRYYYPDVSVTIRGEAQLADDDNLLNPLIVFEVLSKSTEARDRGRKFLGYQAIESLQEYVLISQDEYLVEHYRRRDDCLWLYTVVRGLDATLPLPAAQCELPLREIYYQVELP